MNKLWVSSPLIFFYNATRPTIFWDINLKKVLVLEWRKSFLNEYRRYNMELVHTGAEIFVPFSEFRYLNDQSVKGTVSPDF